MDTKVFLDNMKIYTDEYIKSSQSSNAFFDYFDSHYEEYTYATPEERVEIRKFIKGGLFKKNQIAYALLMYVKEKALRELKSTKDVVWLRRGLVALSMENYSTSFIDKTYNPSSMKTNADYLLADLNVTAVENKIDAMPVFRDIANLSDEQRYMREVMGMGGIGKLYSERSENGEFVGIEW